MKYGLIGEKLGHSYSKVIHETIADYTYDLCEIAREDVDEFMTKKDFAAINVTIPYKETVIPYLDEISERAGSIGAVNTVVNRDGKLYGDNTDFGGMCALVKHAGIDVSGKKVLVLGTGGTSKTAVAVMKHLGAGETVVVSRKAADGVCTYEMASKLHFDAGIIVNTTPVGMFPSVDAMPVDLSLYPNVSGVIDAIFNPLRTDLVMDAKKRGIAAEGGLYMLCAQAVYASAVFRGCSADESLIEKAYRKVLDEKENIVLVGMPTSGKSCVGKLLSELMGREFIDSDDVLKSRVGSVADYINENGEAAFRKLEGEVISELSKKNSLVIATGGGVVLSEENVRLLKKNGRLILLDRSPEKLIPSPDRPLSSTPEKLKALYEKRYPIYLSACDIKVNGDGDPMETANAVLKEI